MELDDADLAVVSLTDKRERQPPGNPGLAGTRRTLKDEVLPSSQPFEHAFNLLAFDEASFVKHVRDRICFTGTCRSFVHHQIGIVVHAVGGFVRPSLPT